jgi:hypothetical protein
VHFGCGARKIKVCQKHSKSTGSFQSRNDVKPTAVVYQRSIWVLSKYFFQVPNCCMGIGTEEKYKKPPNLSYRWV